MDKRVNINQLMSLYMIENDKKSISYEELQRYLSYMQDCFNANEDEIKIKFSSNFIKDLREDDDNCFVANLYGIGAKVSDLELYDRFLEDMDTHVLFVTTTYTQDYFTKKKEAEKFAQTSKESNKEINK